MTNISCFIAGAIDLAGSLVLLSVWHRRTGARLYPALIAFAVCFPVFFFGSIVRSGFSRDDAIAFYIQQGLLFGFLEESAKFVMLRFYLTAYDSPRDAVTYGIGHSYYENFGSGITCLSLIGSGIAASDIALNQFFAFVEGTAFVIASTVLIFYGIRREKTIVVLPAVILVHAVSNAAGGIFIMSFAIVVRLLTTTGLCFAAYRCYERSD